MPAAKRSAWKENLESLLWAAAFALAIRTFIIAPFKIPSGSMRMTLVEGDRILVNKFIYHFREPRRGDIIVFRFPSEPKRPFIKRLVGLGGDEVEIREGAVLVNGQPLAGYGGFETRSYVNQGQLGGFGQVVHVPPGEVYVLGDNSASSHDSRFWGFVPRRFLIGQAVWIFWPPKRMRLLR
jgi:signal peptidase I